MEINNWSESEVNRAASTWGKTYPRYSQEMYNFAIKDVRSWLDLGCGFGRFLAYLLNRTDEPEYIGYDSSPAMIKRIGEAFPEFAPLTFRRNITDKIVHRQESILCSAVMIHITKEDQDKVLQNVLEISPKKFAFDINSPAEAYLAQNGADFERYIKGTDGRFRMTWQSHYKMTEKLLSLFKNYTISLTFYSVNRDRHKVVYFLEKK